MQNDEIFMDVKAQLQFLRLTVMSGAHLTMRQCVKQSSLMVPLCWFRYICSSGKRWAILLLALSLKQYDTLCQQRCLESWVCTMKFANVLLTGLCFPESRTLSWISARSSPATRALEPVARSEEAPGHDPAYLSLRERQTHTHIKEHKTKKQCSPYIH